MLPKLEELTITDSRGDVLSEGDFRRRRVAELRAQLNDPAHAYMDGDVRMWLANDSVISPSLFEEAFVACPEAQAVARKIHVAALFADYRAAQGPVTAEQRAEARAAHGPGVEIVDVISGRRFTT